MDVVLDVAVDLQMYFACWCSFGGPGLGEAGQKQIVQTLVQQLSSNGFVKVEYAEKRYLRDQSKNVRCGCNM